MESVCPHCSPHNFSCQECYDIQRKIDRIRFKTPFSPCYNTFNCNTFNCNTFKPKMFKCENCEYFDIDVHSYAHDSNIRDVCDECLFEHFSKIKPWNLCLTSIPLLVRDDGVHDDHIKIVRVDDAMFELLKSYATRANISLEDALYRSQTCHGCNAPMENELFGQLSCSKACENRCFYGKRCAICPGIDYELLKKFSTEQQTELCEYAKIHYLSIDQAIDYQTHCHNCGKGTPDSLIRSDSHQYCSSRCQEYCEVFCYSCVYEKECLVCHSI